jgi:hypothetical protein
MNKSLALNLRHVGYAVRMIDPIAANYVRRTKDNDDLCLHGSTQEL